MDLNRRKLFSLMPYGLIGITGMSLWWLCKPYSYVYPKYWPWPEYNVKSKLSSHEAKQLESLLEHEDTIAIPDKSMKHHDYPEISYTYMSSLIRPRPVLVAMGTSYVMDKNGFFVTAGHLAHPGLHLADRSNTAYFDPLTGTVSTGKIIAYSGKYESAVGKLDTELPYHPTRPLSTRLPENDETVYVVRYSDKTWIKALFDEVLPVVKGGHLNVQCPALEVKKVDVARFFDDGTPVGKSRMDYLIRYRAEAGDSGSPVLDQSGALSGIVWGELKQSRENPLSSVVSAKTIRKTCYHALEEAV
jgi:hypothetical protein